MLHETGKICVGVGLWLFWCFPCCLQVSDNNQSHSGTLH